MKKALSKSEKYSEELRSFALSFPDTREEYPWGEVVVKVAKKVFLFSGKGTSGVGVSVKLSESQIDALEFPFCEPTGYGLGKHGWVSARFAAKDAVPIDLLKAWITESFRNVAPKKLVKAWAEGASETKQKILKKAPKKRAKKA